MSNKEIISIIKDDIENLGSFFSFFKNEKLKKGIFFNLKDIESSLEEIPKLMNALENNKTEYTQLGIRFDTYKNDTEQKYNELEIDFGSYKKKTNQLLVDRESKINQITSKLSEIKNKQLLISSLLSSKSSNKGLEEYKTVLNNDFMEFANYEESLANEAEAILKLQAIEKELEVITAYPQLHKKNTVAVGGGFSAGKSEFISSFFKSGVKLPIGINPTTAIPTYVMNTNENQVIACSSNGGIVDLRNIDDDFHSKISHDFIKSFDFNLKEIMPLMIVGTQIEQENICFIDTPGYNPPNSDETYSEDDVHTAKEFLSNASAFIWLIGADANGTISSSDIDFLNELDLDNKKVFVVYNKSDLRSQDDLEEVVEEIKESLDDYGIECIGISAFSSLSKQEYIYKKKSLFEFIQECDYESQVHEDIVKKLYEVYKMYKRAILTNIKEKEAIKSHIKSISLDMLEEGFDDITKPAFQRLDKLSKVFSTKKQERNLKVLESVIQKLKEAVDHVFEHEISIDFEDVLKHEIEIDFDFDIEDLESDEIVFKSKKTKRNNFKDMRSLRKEIKGLEKELDNMFKAEPEDFRKKFDKKFNDELEKKIYNEFKKFEYLEDKLKTLEELENFEELENIKKDLKKIIDFFKDFKIIIKSIKVSSVDDAKKILISFFEKRK